MRLAGLAPEVLGLRSYFAERTESNSYPSGTIASIFALASSYESPSASIVSLATGRMTAMTLTIR